MTVFARSIALKIVVAFSFVVLILLVSYIIMVQRLDTIEESISNVANISNYSNSTVGINKDIVEMQRDISVYSISGSRAVFEKINENHSDIKSRLLSLKVSDSISEEEEDNIKKLSELVDKIGANLTVLPSIYRERQEMLNVVLESVYQSAIKSLAVLRSNTKDPVAKLEILEVSNDWHALHRSAWLFLSRKDYAKKREVASILSGISMKSQRFDESNYLNNLVKKYQASFAKTVQVNRNYLNLVNIVIAGDVNEFGILSNSLRELSFERLKNIKKVSDDSVSITRTTLNILSFAIIFYLLLLAWFFHAHITKAISRLTDSFSRFLSGDLSATVPHSKRTDEIGVLAQAASRFRDMSIDLEKEKKAAEHTSKVKSEFLANMSHEIRTPMNGVLGMATNLQDTELTIKQKEMLDIIISSGKSLLVVINDILDLSKIEADKIYLESSPIDLNNLFYNLEILFKKQVSDKDINFYIDVIYTGDSVEFIGDETRIKQILINLIGNAVKFTEKGEVVVKAHVNEENNGKVKINFSVVDTGIGIESTYLDSLFDAFSQADTSITRKFGGTGLGLTITSKLLGLMGSKLNVESELGKGSKFSFEIDSNLCFQEESVHNKINADEKIKLDFSRLNVLVAEDNKTNQVVIRALLSKLNVGSITLVENGEEAVNQCIHEEFDLIFMDMQMPVIDGLQATLQIKAMRQYRNIPIIALTANVFEEDKKKCSEVGMCDFIGKPIDIDQLEEVLNRWSINQ